MPKPAACPMPAADPDPAPAQPLCEVWLCQEGQEGGKEEEGTERERRKVRERK